MFATQQHSYPAIFTSPTFACRLPLTPPVRFLQNISSQPTDLANLIPFVKQWYGHDSTYLWYDDEGTLHEIQQGEGIEQGDALAPALFALASLCAS